MIEQVHDALWVAEGEIVSFFGFPYPTRSVIARLKNGDLWVWSPVKLTAALRTEVDRRGPVRHLVSPNKLHHLHLQEWKAAYPEAQLWGPQATYVERPRPASAFFRHFIQQERCGHMSGLSARS